MEIRRKPRVTVTVGPSNFTEERWKAYAQEGVHGFRVPFAKETPSAQFERCKALAEIVGQYSPAPRVIADLPGRRPRFGNVAETQIAAGSEYTLVPEMGEGERELPCTHFEMISSLHEGDRIVAGDGELHAYITSKTGDRATIKFVESGILKRQRGLYSPSFSQLLGPIDALEHSFLEDSRVKYIDAIMLSFCSKPSHLLEFSDLLRARGSDIANASLIAKIETPHGIASATDLLATGCELLLGRGDLFVTSTPAEFFSNENIAVQTCSDKGMVDRLMVGTGLLDQFAQTGVVSRAETSYLGWLVSMGVNSFLLSGETTVGTRGLECVRLINEIAGSNVQ